MLEYRNVKMFLQKVTFQTGLKKFFWLKILKIVSRGHISLKILTMNKLLQRFMKNNWKKKANQKVFRAEKVMKRKDDKLFNKWNSYDNSFNSWIDKNDIIQMS